jgi:hypothetical protein
MAADGAVARSGGRGRVELGLPGLATERFKEKGAQATKRNWAKGENGLQKNVFKFIRDLGFKNQRISKCF